MTGSEIPAGSIWKRLRGDPAAVEFHAVVEPMGDGAPHERSPLDEGIAVLVRGVADRTCQAQLFVISAELGSALGVQLSGLLPGDTVRIAGVPDPASDPIGQAQAIRLIRNVHTLQLVQRAPQTWHRTTDLIEVTES